MLTWAIQRAIERGIDHARNRHKDIDGPYHLNHPLFPFWWGGVVAKADCRDWPEDRIIKKVLSETKPKRLV